MYLLTWTLRFGVLGAHFVAALPPGSTLSPKNLLDRDEVAQAELSASLISTSPQILPIPFGTPASNLSNRSPAEEVQKLEARKKTSLKVSSTKKTATKPATSSVEATSVAAPLKASSTKTSIAAIHSKASRSNATPTLSSKATSTSHQGTLAKSSSTQASSSIASYVKPILIKSGDSVTASPITIKLNTPTQMRPKKPLPTPSKGPSFADALDDSLTAKQKADTVKVNKTDVISLAKRGPLEIAKRSGEDNILSWKLWKQAQFRPKDNLSSHHSLFRQYFGSTDYCPAQDPRNEASIGRNEKTADLDYFVQERTPQPVIYALNDAIAAVYAQNDRLLARDYMNTRVGWWITQQDRL
ncbi:hypothetical protein CC78DRAFT_548958 [Lojkania enalia]|uniref:Uncharacterized protein n=1 Tax=Lojkania enalia TaxID=147567 RepID=A0A9P4JZE0_9PLEO|nr:hypothetical protein CC78DRAFT_548958 [Didymosphaeria enalia]